MRKIPVDTRLQSYTFTPMSSHASTYCKTLAALPVADAINAIHFAYLQFLAAEKGVDCLDNRPVMKELKRLLALSGHIGFDSHAHTPPDGGPTKVELLQAAFNQVCDPADWKAPIAANVLDSQMDITIAAIVHFTATSPRFVQAGRNDKGEAIFHVTSLGYRAGPAGDH